MKPYKILIVDDYPNLIEMLKIRLETFSFDVITSLDGIEALQSARTHHPDLIILDVMLPRMDGFKICRLLKYDEKTKHIPVIMLTSRARDIDKKTGYDMGADAYMFKPYDAKILIPKIYELLKEPAPSLNSVA
jgi:two-component system, OmpR family, alkaline phosphatase synthesis response regulator PhoP